MTISPVSRYDPLPDRETQAARPATWLAFVRLELIGPLDALAGLCELLGQEVGDKRPEEYLADVRKLQQAARRLLEFANAMVKRDAEVGSAQLEEDLRRCRHDLGNYLNQVSGVVQLLQMAEEALFGALLSDLQRLLDLCHDCEARLLRHGNPVEPEAPAFTDSDLFRVAEHIRPVEGCQSDRETQAVGSILLTDDDPLNREVLRRLLEHEGHSVTEAGNGHEALRLLDERPFDILLLDVLMPGLNGFQVLERLCKENRLRSTSVIVISALDEVHGVARCLQGGAEDYLTKPIDKTLLHARINSCLLKRRQRVRELEQFFPAEIVAQLLDRPELLHTGKSADVTILFCDIRGFSRVSERLRGTPEKILEWVSSVMELLCDCVLRHQGVLVDFIGDELLAMWGAPQSQPDHARRACRAALDMLEALPRLSAVWQPVVEEETVVGIGINSGPVSVGNTGTKRRFKYGPLGDTVNLASRIQGATKYLKARALLTQSTREHLGDDFALRRLARLEVVNIKDPVAVYELAPPNQPKWSELKEGYEEALRLFEAGPDHCEEAVRVLGGLVTRFGVTGPNLFLMSRILGAMQDRNTWSSVYVLPGK